MTGALDAVRVQALRSLIPPPRLRLSAWIETHVRLPEGLSATPGPVRLWPFQREIADCIGDYGIERVTLVKPVRVGFALAVDTPIPTPDGWATMGQLVEGATVFGAGGIPVRVSYVSPIYRDRPCYEIEFCDGSTIVADEGHQWAIESTVAQENVAHRGQTGRPWGSRDGEPRGPIYRYVCDTATLFRYHRRGARHVTVFAVANAAPLDMPDRVLPVPPYTLGMWLGDGHSQRNIITQHIGDVETADYIRADGILVTIRTKNAGGPNNLAYDLDRERPRVWSQLWRNLHALNLRGRGARKHIPQLYLRASATQRLSLLQGLMDSDGTVGKQKGFAEFTNTNKELARGVYELVVSLGYKATFKKRSPPRRSVLEQWRVVFKSDPARSPFRLRRKAARVVPLHKPTISRRRRIVAVRSVPSVPVRCIAVESTDHLYLAGRQMVPTHNTTLLTSAIASFVANDPAPILCLLPTESDARDFTVSEIEPLCAATPAVAGMLQADANDGARNTLLSRRFPGGSLKIVAAKAPRNLRRHTARVLLIDEADAMEIGAEGSPILLAERRTLSYADRKIVLGSTPILEETSHVLRAYAQSDQRVLELPCPACEGWTELRWAHIEWEPGHPETAAFRCPRCQALIPETAKPAMVEAGRWRATHPEVQGHAGFRLSALVSLLANASWAKIAAEFLRVKDDSDELQTWTNTLLGEGWREAAVEVDEYDLAARAEPFGLDRMPQEVLILTCGIDVQDDRFEATIVGWSRTETFVLGHFVIWGSPDEDATLAELDELLRTKWTHPTNNYKLGIDATIVDSGDRTDRIYAFCFPRANRRVFAGKGIAGSRPVCEPSRGKVRGGRLMLVGVDTIKATLMDRMARGRLLRFSDALEPSYYEQLASERKVVRYTRGQPVRRFERKPGAQAEALDCLVYSFAARPIATVSLETREATLRNWTTPPTKEHGKRPVRYRMGG